MSCERSCLALAHVGDAVYELLVRARLSQNSLNVSRLHGMTVEIVCAGAQAVAAARLYEALDEEEKSVFRRARNTKLHHVPHGAALSDYAAATALEAVFGWLYLNGKGERITELFNVCYPE